MKYARSEPYIFVNLSMQRLQMFEDQAQVSPSGAKTLQTLTHSALALKLTVTGMLWHKSSLNKVKSCFNN